MKLILTAALAQVLTLTQAFALTVEQATQLIVGSWATAGGGETYVFDTTKMEWTQYIGSAVYVTKFQLKEMPANLFQLTSVQTKTTYTVHVGMGGELLKVYESDKALPVAELFRVKLD